MKHEGPFQFQTTAAATAAHCRSIVVADLKATLSSPHHWTKGASARDEGGAETYASGPSAHSFDLWGAMYRSVWGRGIPFYIHEPVLNDLAAEMRSITGRPPAPWNDDPARTFDDVLELLSALPD